MNASSSIDWLLVEQRVFDRLAAALHSDFKSVWAESLDDAIALRLACLELFPEARTGARQLNV